MGNLPETYRENMTLTPNIFVYIFIPHTMIVVRSAETINNNNNNNNIMNHII
jgi:hypothetical protein